MTTALVHHPIYQKHNTGVGHPETAARYEVVMNALKEDAEFWESLDEITPDSASKGLILAAHSAQHYKRVEGAFEHRVERLDADTVISMKSFEAAMFAAGGAIAGVDAVMQTDARNAFVAVRPPGHHASAENAMGFCIFNNVAVAARYAQNNYKEIDNVAILDWDVHHGNGTQGIFYDDPSVYFFSMHQYPWYPGTGAKGETGFGRGLGKTMNIPVKANTIAAEQTRMFEAALEDISSKFKPDLIIISAGFDGHLTDPLGQLKLEDTDFAAMTNVVKQWADDVCDARIVSVLEGGYNLDTLGLTVKNHVAELSR